MSDLKSMRTLLAIRDSKSLTMAAEQLNEPKSTISRRITILETYLNTRLTCLSGRRLSLTKEGLCYADYCEQILNIEQSGREALKALRSSLSGKISVGLTTELSRGWSTECLHRFTKKYPDINLEVQMVDCANLLFNESIDIWISCCPLLKSQGVRSVKLGHWERGLYQAKQLPPLLKLDQLKTCDWVCSSEESDTIQFFDDHSSWKMHPQQTTVINSLHMRADAIAQGFGVGLLPCWIAECKKHGVHKYERLYPDLRVEGVNLSIHYKISNESLIIKTLRQWLENNLPARWK
ncbi:LysR family transcriptional regulator [Marinomonas algarum]|uniref:LysR family transcriptional regulator n=1 Tax=Marinomonas algarum TaxID=2883105 RepID=A0A9X1RUI9_9GAMM|nr:LysR family transcriptional regulator [Marinomonas algarum]MCB5163178.1 LysR family transcriptional regulator [Marinomonas algarum]